MKLLEIAKEILPLSILLFRFTVTLELMPSSTALVFQFYYLDSKGLKVLSVKSLVIDFQFYYLDS